MPLAVSWLRCGEHTVDSANQAVMGAAICRKRFPGLDKWNIKQFYKAWSRVTTLRIEGSGPHDTPTSICMTQAEFRGALHNFSRVSSLVHLCEGGLVNNMCDVVLSAGPCKPATVSASVRV